MQKTGNQYMHIDHQKLQATYMAITGRLTRDALAHTQH
jgi:hypothetical protein